MYIAGSSGPVLVFLHGGGHSALSWAVLTKHLLQKCVCQVVALDIRGHGDTRTNDDTDLSKERLIQDVEDVIFALFKDSIPPLVLIGHSMGGAMAVHTAAKGGVPNLAALFLIDVVEATALESLSHMQSFLSSRPQTFRNVEHAIEWRYSIDT